MLRIVLW